jgi:hypothetical protein
MLNGNDSEEYDKLVAHCAEGMTEDEKIIFINKMQDMRTELLQEQSELERQNLSFGFPQETGTTDQPKKIIVGSALTKDLGSSSANQRVCNKQNLIPTVSNKSFVPLAKVNKNLENESINLIYLEDERATIQEYIEKTEILKKENAELRQKLNVLRGQLNNSALENQKYSELAVQYQHLDTAYRRVLSDLHLEKEKSSFYERKYYKELGMLLY